MMAADPLPGEVCAQFIRYGKTGCRCRTGLLHGPYHYRVWREGSKVHKAYAKVADVPGVQARCEAYRAIQIQLRQRRQERQELAQRIAKECRRTKRLLRAELSR